MLEKELNSASFIHWLAWYRDNVSKWGDMFIHGLSFLWASTIKIQLTVLV